MSKEKYIKLELFIFLCLLCGVLLGSIFLFRSFQQTQRQEYLLEAITEVSTTGDAVNNKNLYELVCSNKLYLGVSDISDLYNLSFLSTQTIDKYLELHKSYITGFGFGGAGSILSQNEQGQVNDLILSMYPTATDLRRWDLIFTAILEDCRVDVLYNSPEAMLPDVLTEYISFYHLRDYTDTEVLLVRAETNKIFLDFYKEDANARVVLIFSNDSEEAVQTFSLSSLSLYVWNEQIYGLPVDLSPRRAEVISIPLLEFVQKSNFEAWVLDQTLKLEITDPID